MIYTERVVTIKKDGSSLIDHSVILYRGDKDVEIIFTIVDSKFKFRSTQGNVIDNTQASYGQLVIINPAGANIFSDVTPCQGGQVVFKMTGSMIDGIGEVGYYTFHIRLFNDDQSSRITLPPVFNGIEVREPLAIENI